MSVNEGTRGDYQRVNSREDRRRGVVATPLSVVSLLVAIVALILVFVMRGCSAFTVTTACPTPTVTVVEVAKLVDVPTAYELWQIAGNDGTIKEYLASLVGEVVVNTFVGSNGFTGPTGPAGESGATGAAGTDGQPGAPGTAGTTGATGKSAYQLWLDAGNTGSPDEFLASLEGLGGANGAAGVSAYDLWILEGNSGTLNDFFDYLSGVDGAPGASAYDAWIAAGNVGTQSDFLDSLVGATGATGATGETGAAGTCTAGDAGPSGAPGATGAPGQTGTSGLSAYEVWLSQGHVGSELVFLASLVGPTGSPGPQGTPGPQGPTGETGAQGPQGIPGTITGFGDSGNFWDVTTQGPAGGISSATNTAYPVYLGQADTANNQGVSVTSGPGDASGRASYLTFTHAGEYNIAFSAQLLRTQGGSTDIVSIWLRKNGVNEPNTNTDITLVANGQRHVAAWNFFVPVTCNPTCDTYQLMWSADGSYTNLWSQAAQTNPDRPAIPSVILTVNQVK